MRDAFNKTGVGVTYFLAAGNVAILPRLLMGDALRAEPNYQASWPTVEGPSLLKYHPLFWAPDVANSKRFAPRVSAATAHARRVWSSS